MDISAINPLSAAATADTSNRIVQKQLGQADFMKLLSVQFQQQDPMKPMDDTAFIAQMAQFSSLQQMTALNTGVDALRTDSQLSSASNLIGREVTVTNTDGSTVTGNVDSVEQTAQGPMLSVNGQALPFAYVTKVAPAAVQTAA